MSLTNILANMRNMSLVYYSGWVVHGNAYGSYAAVQAKFQIIALSPMGPGILLLLPLVKKWGRRQCCWVGGTLCAVGSLATFLSPGHGIIIYIGTAFGAIGSLFFNYTMITYMGDVIDHVEWKTKIRCDGVTGGFTSAALMFAVGIAQGLFNLGLMATGYAQPRQIGTGADGVALYADQAAAATGWADLDSLAATVALSLRPRTRYTWTVAVRTDAGEEGTSGENWFETGKLNEPWAASWIGCEDSEPRHPVFFRDITPVKPVAAARLYICGLGLYEAAWNGEKLGGEYLTPYCNNYNSFVQYQTYDVTEQLQRAGTLSVTLGNGWYKGRFGYDDRTGKPYYGDSWKLLAELRLTYADGTEEVIGTDEKWTVIRSNITFSNIYDGEHRDDTLPALPPEKARLAEPSAGRLTERYSTPVHRALAGGDRPGESHSGFPHHRGAGVASPGRGAAQPARWSAGHSRRGGQDSHRPARQGHPQRGILRRPRRGEHLPEGKGPPRRAVCRRRGAGALQLGNAGPRHGRPDRPAGGGDGIPLCHRLAGGAAAGPELERAAA